MLYSLSGAEHSFMGRQSRTSKKHETNFLHMPFLTDPLWKLFAMSFLFFSQGGLGKNLETASSTSQHTGRHNSQPHVALALAVAGLYCTVAWMDVFIFALGVGGHPGTLPAFPAATAASVSICALARSTRSVRMVHLAPVSAAAWWGRRLVKIWSWES